MLFSGKIDQDKKRLKSVLDSDDVIFFDFKANGKKCLTVYVDSITDKRVLGELVIRATRGIDANSDLKSFREGLCNPECKEQDNVSDAVNEVLNGSALLVVDGEKKTLSFDIKKFDQRAVTEPPTSAVVKGPREGFTESIKTNLSLLRRRIKNKDLKIEYLTVGKYSQTTVAVCYVDSICDMKVVKSIKERISRLDIDGIPDSSYVSNQIIEHKTSLFKQVGNTEKPDVLMAKILEGRIGIIVDGSPIAITVPYVFLEDFQSSEDYFKSYYRANTERVLRLISIILAIYLPALFVAAELFHLQLIPLNFLLTIVSSIKGIPLSPSFEMFFTLLIFEILNQASIRMPKYVGMALSIVGAIVLGDTAVRAGIVSTPTIMIMALSGICLYTVPELVDTMSFLRVLLLIIAGSTGGYGILLATSFIVIYLCSLENFNVPFLAPYAPLVANDLKDSIYMTFPDRMKKRPFSFRLKNNVRLKIKKEHPDE